MKILLVEDEESIARPLEVLLRAQGWQVLRAGTVAGARQLIGAQRPEAAIVDLGLPDGSGEEVCRQMRRAGDGAVLVLTARSDEESVVRALEEGADDYIAKPFRARELVSRVRAVLRRKGGQELYRCGSLCLDRRAAQVWRAGEPVPLTAQEYRLLLRFVANPGQVLERGQLLGALWDEGGSFVEDNTLTVTVKRLRQKLGPEGERIVTVRGLGYRWEVEP